MSWAVMEPERAWVGPSLLGMSAYRTVRSGLSIEYGISKHRANFSRSPLPYLIDDREDFD